MRLAPEKKQNRIRSLSLGRASLGFPGRDPVYGSNPIIPPDVRQIYSFHTLPPESPTEILFLPYAVGPPWASAVQAGLGAPVPLANSLGVFN